MKKIVFCALLCAVSMTFLLAAPVSIHDAELVARNFVMERLGSSYYVTEMMPLESNHQDAYIYVADMYPQGYVLIAGDDAAYPILGYSAQNNWNEFEKPDQFQAMLQNWNEQMHAIVSERMQADLPTTVTWNKYRRDADSFVPIRNLRSVSPLITSTWGQGTYYNAQTPAGTPVGCVATTMSQIMRYWAFPTIGQGEHSYVHPTYGTQSANFGETIYDWASMPNSLNSHNVAVATIGYHTGVSVNMNYGPDGSGAYSTAVAPALISYFKYASSAELRYKNHYTNAMWLSILRGELDNARPMYYSGYSSGSGGHAWVLDGYQGDDHFHMNWGWYGYYNGYYYLTNLNPGTYDFTQGQDAVTGIVPSEISDTLNEGFEGTTFPPEDWDVTASSFVRSTTAPINGAASARYGSAGNTSGKRLITPLLIIEADTELSYAAKSGTNYRDEQILVRYSVDGTTWTTLTTHILSVTPTTYTAAFSAVTPGNYYVCFETYSSDTNNGRQKTYFIDDVTGPDKWVSPDPIAAINITSWDAGSIQPGQASHSGAIFQLANVGRGTLTIESVTNLAFTEFTSSINTNLALVSGQTHAFGFSYEPVNFGTDNVTFNINTNAGTVTVSLTGEGAEMTLFSDGFEEYEDFILDFPPWTQYDGDGSATYSIQDVTFPNQGYTGSYIIFNPNQTNPPIGGADAYGGEKYAAAFSATSPPNDDWLISPALEFAGSPSISFWARSYVADWGLERFRVLYSTTGNNVADFAGNYLAGSATTHIEAPVEWQNYTYPLPASCENTTVYIAIQCVSNDAFIFMVDNFEAMDDSPSEIPDFGHINGYVYESGTTNPIANALVKIGSKQDYTDVNGFYQINHIVVGTYNVTASAPGMFYFSETVSGVNITVGNTTSQDFGLTWSELEVNPTSISASVFSAQTDVVELQISNPGGTANLEYSMFFTSASTAERLNNQFTKRKPAESSPNTRPFSPTSYPQERAEGWISYADPADANYYSYPVPERATKFYIEEFGMFAQGVTISQLRHYFYDVDGNNWGGDDSYQFKIYDADGSTVLYTSPTLTAVNWPTANDYTLTTPLHVTNDFWVSIVPGNSTSGAPYSIGTDASIGNSWAGEPGMWEMLDLDLIIMAYIEGSEWVEASQYSGTVAPAGTDLIDVIFDSTGLPAGTKNAFLHIYNNSDYIAPSGSRGDVMVVPVSLEVITPLDPTAYLNRTSWTTIAETGTPSNSGDIFQLKNVGMGSLTITSISGLSGTPFTTNFDTEVVLEQDQTHNFGFAFNPPANGIYNETLEIVTNGGTKTVTLKGYGNYLFEGFEGETFPPDGWMAVDDDGDGHNWFVYTNDPHSGTQCAASASWVPDTRNNKKKTLGRGALTPDNWLITPKLTVTSGDELSFWVGAQDPEWPQEFYSVKVSTTDSALGSFTDTIHSETLLDGNWHNRVIPLDYYVGQEIYIAFQHHNCTDWFILKLDDVLMPPLAAPLIYGDATGVVYKFGTSTPVQDATVSIAGRSDVTGVDGIYTINNIVAGEYQLTASAEGHVDYQNSVTIPEESTLMYNIYMDWAEVYTVDVNFSTTVNMNGTASIPVQMTNVGTSLLEYETASGIYGGDVHPAGYLNEDFEDLDITGWTGFQGHNTGIYGGGHGYDGSTYVWGFNSDQTYEPQYLITPQLRVETGDMLSFWYKQFNASDEELSVLVSTTDNDIASFTNTLADIGPLADTEWYNFNESLDAYAGMDIYICFYYPRVDGYEYGYFLIDDITGPQVILPPSGWLSSTPVLDELAAGLSETLYLNIDATGLPLGNYTAQTWIFSNGINSPYQLYVSIEVDDAAPPEPPDAPVNVAISRIAGGIAMSWDAVESANSYRVEASETPAGVFAQIGVSATNSTSFTDVELEGFGLTSRAFFHVIADTEVRLIRSSLRVKETTPGTTVHRMFGKENLNFVNPTKRAN